MATRYDLVPDRNIQEPLAERRWFKPPEITAFGPGKPVLPTNEEDPRIFDYPAGINLVSIPRGGYGLAPFALLRALARASKEVRLNIELIKRELRALEWKIIPADPEDKGRFGEEIAATAGFFASPDGLHDFDQWLAQVLEDVLAIDALALWPEIDAEGNLVAIEGLDGATIRPLLDLRGRIALPPVPAYVQVVKGLPYTWCTRSRIIYRPFNVVTYTPYGTSPIEFVIMVINLALRRDTFHIATFTEGNVPEALVGMPSSWSQPQIETWQQYWDALVAGNISEQRKIHFIPHEGSGSLPVYAFNKSDVENVARDEWLMRVACWAFGNSPSEFGLIPGSGFGGKGFTKGMENIQYRSMIGPVAQFLSSTLNMIIARWMRRPYLRWKWVGMDPQDDQMQQAQIDEVYLRNGVYSLAYVQDRLGVPPSMRPEGPPQPGGASGMGLLPALYGNPMAGYGAPPLQETSGGALEKAEAGDKDPDYEAKTQAMEGLRSAWQRYLRELRARIVEAMADGTVAG